MGYAEFLQQMLSPLGIYNLKEGFSYAETQAVGKALDGGEEAISKMLETPEGENLNKLEALFPIMNFEEGETERYAAVKTLLGVDDQCCSAEKLENQLSACGLACEISETENKFVVNVTMGDIRGEVSDEEAETVKSVMPAHVMLNFICRGVTWDRIEARYPTWNAFDAAGLTVSEMLKLE